MIRAFSFLFRDPQSGLLHFRLRVPGHLQAAVGKVEIKRSLRTADKRLAIPVVYRLYAEFHDYFKCLENGEPMQKPKRQKKENFGVLGKITFGVIALPGGAVAKNVIVDTGDDAKDVNLAKELLGDIQQTTGPAASPVHSAQVAKAYRAEKIKAGLWTPGTAAEHEQRKIRWKKRPPASPDEHFRRCEDAPRTVNEKLQQASRLFLWVTRHGYTALNPFEGLKMRLSGRGSKECPASRLRRFRG